MMAGQVTILHAPPIVLALFLVRALRLLPPFWNLSYAASPNKAIPVKIQYPVRVFTEY
jgi:hypothetical protein